MKFAEGLSAVNWRWRMNKEDELALRMLNWHFLMVSTDLHYKSKGFVLSKETGNFEKGEVKLKLDLNKN